MRPDDVGTLRWKDLSKPERRVLECLYGGGSISKADAGVLSRLRDVGLIEGVRSREKLSHFGKAFLEFEHAEMKARLGIE